MERQASDALPPHRIHPIATLCRINQFPAHGHPSLPGDDHRRHADDADQYLGFLEQRYPLIHQTADNAKERCRLLGFPPQSAPAPRLWALTSRRRLPYAVPSFRSARGGHRSGGSPCR